MLRTNTEKYISFFVPIKKLENNEKKMTKKKKKKKNTDSIYSKVYGELTIKSC